MSPPRRYGALLPALALIAVLAAAVWRARSTSPPSQPLPGDNRAVVLLLAPGASLADWEAAGLTRLGGVLALMPTRSGEPGPDGAFAAAVRTLAYGSRSPSVGSASLAEAVQAGGGQIVALNGGAAVAPLAGAPAPESSFRLPSPADAPDGYATDVAGLVRELAPPAPNNGGPRDTRSRGDAGGFGTKGSGTPIIGGGGGRTLTIAVYDDLLRAEREAPLCLPAAAEALRRGARERLADLVRRLTAPGGLPAGTALLVVTPLPSDAATERRERLGPVLLWRRDGGSGLLASPSTRGIPGLLPNTDVAATIVALLGRTNDSPRVGAGRAVGLLPHDGSAPDYLSRRATAWAAQAREQRLLVFVPWALAALLLVAAWRRNGSGFATVAAASVPLALLLGGAFAPGGEGTAWVIFAMAATAAVVAGGIAARTQTGATVVCGVAVATALLLLGDTLLGGPLLGRSPLSYSVLEAARFYGVGNEASGLLLGASLLAAALCGRTLLVAALAGAAVALTLGLPMLGADAGGLVAALAGFGAWGWLLRQNRSSSSDRRRPLIVAGLTGIVALALIAAYALWDAGRGAGVRTHVGEAVAAARQRGASALGEIVARKAAVNVRLLVTSPWAALLAAEAGTLYRVRRRRRDGGDVLRSEERAALITAGALFLLNDSGVVAAATCLLLPTASVLAQSGVSEAVSPNRSDLGC